MDTRATKENKSMLIPLTSHCCGSSQTCRLQSGGDKALFPCTSALGRDSRCSCLGHRCHLTRPVPGTHSTPVSPGYTQLMGSSGGPSYSASTSTPPRTTAPCWCCRQLLHLQLLFPPDFSFWCPSLKIFISAPPHMPDCWERPKTLTAYDRQGSCSSPAPHPCLPASPAPGEEGWCGWTPATRCPGLSSVSAVTFPLYALFYVFLKNTLWLVNSLIVSLWVEAQRGVLSSPKVAQLKQWIWTWSRRPGCFGPGFQAGFLLHVSNTKRGQEAGLLLPILGSLN